jgi:putative flippase GtrA
MYTLGMVVKQVSKSKHLGLFVSFAFFGLLAVGVDLCIYGSLVWVGIDPIISNFISSSSGILLNFILVSNFTFDVDYKNMRNFIVFFAIAIFVLLLSSIFLSLLIHTLGISPIVAKFSTLPISALIKFALNRKYTFEYT